ncbi:MAG: response regulator [Lachnospiraceae bacterium]|nr:response regulator [Lachnospiraceae bacterium]
MKKEVNSNSHISKRIIFMVEMILLISSILFCSVSVYRARTAIRKAIQQRMLDIANCASASVDGDVLRDLKKEDVGNAVYKDMYNKLAIFRDNVELEYIYSIKKEGDGQYVFTMDLDQVDPAGYGDSVKYTAALDSAGHGKAAVDEVPYSDKWGEFYSAYSPVFDSKGEVAGIIAVDFTADWFEAQLSTQMRSTVISYLIILLFSLLVAGALSFIIVRPFVRMQGELIEEKVRAESANIAKSDFLANMSHEIRTPINAVLGMNEMILREGRATQEKVKNDSQAVKDSLKNIVVYATDVENAGHNLLAIVNDILDFSKIEAGRMDLVQSPYQLSSMLNELSNMMHIKAKDKGLDLVIDVDQSLPDELSGDEVRVKQIFSNILVNAVKYTEKGSVCMKLRGEKISDDEIMLTLSVKDTGIGIKQKDIDKLFNKFQRLEMERNSTVEGTGLGLVITQRLLEMMKGKISVVSEYGKGSEFTVNIPQKIINDAPMGDFQTRFEANVLQAGMYRESFRAPSAHVLIVDDTKVNLTVVTNLLKNTQMVLDTAICGADAVSMAKDKHYDVILMDQRMPEMDGTQALHRIRETEGGASSDVPIICLTADAVVGARERYLKEGFSDYLTKPIDSYALEKMLMKHLPEEKIERICKEAVETADDTKQEQEGFDILKNAGIDTQKGLVFCNNDNELYTTMLTEYVQEKKNKTKNIETSFENKDWKNYAVYVHSVKSSSKMIGAMSLSEKAAKLEAAADSADEETIYKDHDDMMSGYEAVSQAIRTMLPPIEEAKEGSDVLEFTPGDDDILEFMPDEE